MAEIKTKHTYTSARRKSNDKWDAQNAKKICFKFMLNTDADIIARLDEQPNKADYLRRLIREDIAREQQK